ncbi:MAG TPA: hypothetical protein VNI55_13025, partial [Gaiellaceae bacterium]|nr:hypothetical protein [Gaiellaceae bacterium]
MKRGSKRWEHVRVERGIYQQSNGKYAVCVMIEGKPRLRTVSSSLASKDVEVEESLENEDARGTFDRILGKPPHLHGRRRQPALDRDRRGRASGGRQWRRSFGLKPHSLEFRR